MLATPRIFIRNTRWVGRGGVSKLARLIKSQKRNVVCLLKREVREHNKGIIEFSQLRLFVRVF